MRSRDLHSGSFVDVLRCFFQIFFLISFFVLLLSTSQRKASSPLPSYSLSLSKVFADKRYFLVYPYYARAPDYTQAIDFNQCPH